MNVKWPTRIRHINRFSCGRKSRAAHIRSLPPSICQSHSHFQLIQRMKSDQNVHMWFVFAGQLTHFEWLVLQIKIQNLDLAGLTIQKFFQFICISFFHISFSHQWTSLQIVEQIIFFVCVFYRCCHSIVARIFSKRKPKRSSFIGAHFSVSFISTLSAYFQWNITQQSWANHTSDWMSTAFYYDYVVENRQNGINIGNYAFRHVYVIHQLNVYLLSILCAHSDCYTQLMK